MARARNIKPSFFVDEEVVELSFSTRLLFIGLWTLADREGRLVDKPKQIKMSLFPSDRIDVNKALDELENAKFIVRYVAEDKRYIQIHNFIKHQKPHPNETPSSIPPFQPKVEVLAPKADAHGLLSSSLPSSSFPSESVTLKDEPMATASPSERDDPVETRIWTDGRELLKRSGMTTTTSGSFLGSMAKTYGKPQLAAAIAETQAQNPADPKSYIVAVLRKRGNAAAQVGKCTEPVPDPDCSECFDLKRVYREAVPGDWTTMKEIPCPECVGVAV